MYIVVDIKNDKIIWTDTRVCTTRAMANNRLEFFQKKHPNKNYTVVKFTKYKLVA